MQSAKGPTMMGLTSGRSALKADTLYWHLLHIQRVTASEFSSLLQTEVQIKAIYHEPKTQHIKQIVRTHAQDLSTVLDVMEKYAFPD